MAEIGATLREARMRAHIDVSEIEAQTKIRAKYLRALENEEWNLLPGPTFVKSFLRTYAQALGLDGKVLVEDYRLTYERADESDFQPIVSPQRRPNQRSRSRSSGPSRGYVIALGTVSAVILLLIVLLLTGKSPKNHVNPPKSRPITAHTGHLTSPSRAPVPSIHKRISLSLRATGTVYVCLIGAGGRKLIAGETLQGGSSTQTFKSRRFELTLGNNAVKLLIDGTPRTVPPSSKPIGYSISASGRRTLSAGQSPTCK